MIILNNVYKSFDEQTVIKGISAIFKRGEMSILLGQSGEGKSVLMKAIVGLETIDSGEIFIEDREVSRFSENEFLEVRRKCCYNYQLPALLKTKTVFQNVALPLVWDQRKEYNIKQRVLDALKKVDLLGVADKKPLELSYGMQKRVSFARSLVIDPDYIIFDEPTSGLDPLTSIKLYDIMKKFVDEYGKGIIVVTHDIQGVSYLGGTINLIKKGKFIFQGTKESFFSSENPQVEMFLSGQDV